MGSWFDPLFDFYSAWSYKRDKEAKYDFSRVSDLLIGGEEADIFRLYRWSTGASRYRGAHNCVLVRCKLRTSKEFDIEFFGGKNEFIYNT